MNVYSITPRPDLRELQLRGRGDGKTQQAAETNPKLRRSLQLRRRCVFIKPTCDSMREMARRVRARKAVDEIDQVRCKSGTIGIMREEVYVDQHSAVVKYNLVFVHFGLCQRDNGRVLGYDNAHGRHERHWMGTATPAKFSSYEQTLRRFLDEVELLREKA